MFSALFGPKKDAKALPPLCVVEGVEGVWSYHLAPAGTLTPLCTRVRPVMATGIPLNGWGHRASHLPEKYCAECEREAVRLGVELGDPRPA